MTAGRILIAVRTLVGFGGGQVVAAERRMRVFEDFGRSGSSCAVDVGRRDHAIVDGQRGRSQYRTEVEGSCCRDKDYESVLLRTQAARSGFLPGLLWHPPNTEGEGLRQPDSQPMRSSQIFL